MTDNTRVLRGVDDFLADLDNVLATTPSSSEPQAPAEPAPAPAPASAEPTPDEPTAEDPDDWYATITASRRPAADTVPDLTQPAPEHTEPRPESSRTRTITAGPGHLPDWRTGPTLDLSKPAEPAPIEPAEPEPATAEPARLTKTPHPEPAEPVEPVEPGTAEPTEPGTRTAPAEPAAEGAGEPAISPARLIATTVRDWRPPTGPKGKAWFRAVAYTGSGIITGFLTGTTHNIYTALNDLAINPDAVAGIALSAALAALMISPSKKTCIALGIALALVLLIKIFTLPLSTGALVTFIAWGLDQRARTMHPVIAWTTRATFAAICLATSALIWTTVVPVLTGAGK